MDAPPAAPAAAKVTPARYTPLPLPDLPTVPAVPPVPDVVPAPAEPPQAPFVEASVPIAIVRPRGAAASGGAAQLPPIPAPPGPEPIPPPVEKAPTRPGVLDRPLDPPPDAPPGPPAPGVEEVFGGPLYTTPVDVPTGFTGPSGIVPQEVQQDNNFVPVEDRWRIGFPEWDRYGKGHPTTDDYPYVRGHWADPYNLNVLKGDYPVIGQHTFFVVTANLKTVAQVRQVPTATTPFESTANPLSEEFFGSPNQFFTPNQLLLSFELFHGDAAFRPMDWRVRLTPVFNANYLAVDELAVVNPDVTRGTVRGRSFLALQEWFFEAKLADLSPDYDFLSVRVGAQPFNSDFRGFIFSDINRGVRLFGNHSANRGQFNLAYFRQLEKDTNSLLNTFDDRRQDVIVANYYLQDFIWPGYTAQVSMHYNHDDPTATFDKNRFLVRPDPAGVFQRHGLDVLYLGWTGDGHINRFNVSHALYWAVGRDSRNPIANTGQDISAGMAACELSYDRDWIRFRTSVLWASGDNDPRNGHATGFDAIFDDPNFAGGEFSFWQRQAIRLFGVNLVNQESLLPNLRSSKPQGQSNFVNPGLLLANLGIDLEVTPKLRVVNNVNFLWFDDVAVLRQFVFQDHIDEFIGTDLSTGVEYRPLLNNNVIFKLGVSALLPGRGFRDLYDDSRDSTDPLVAAFLEMNLLY
jgi:hypothetical protein